MDFSPERALAAVSSSLPFERSGPAAIDRMRLLSITKFVERMREPREYRDVLLAVQRLAAHPDPIFRDFALRRATWLAEELQQLATGHIVFNGTETWRSAYEKILLSLDFADYRSVSWVRSEGYWRDLPGRQSMRLNYQLLDKGLRIERVLILGHSLWDGREDLPKPAIRRWIEDQHYRGISILLVRESYLQYEQDIFRDFGIYGDRATGEQELDEQSRTIRFTLRFDEASRRIANDRWERLQLFAFPYAEILDRANAG